MRRPLLLTSLSLAVLLSANVLAQDPVEIQFLIDPVLVQTGTEIVFTALTVPQVLTMTWQYEGLALGVWAGGDSVIAPVPQFQGRVTITATQLQVGGAQLVDSGTYTVQVTPIATTGLGRNSRSIQLSVFDAVTGVSLVVPTIAVEGRNVTLRCTWTGGTNATVQWGRGGAAVTPDSRVTVSGAILSINPARRSDAGEYTCTASNPVSAQTATQSLTVYSGHVLDYSSAYFPMDYLAIMSFPETLGDGPDAPVLTKDTPKECVGGGDVLAGQTVRLTCMSDSLPPALFTWQFDGQTVASGQPDSGVLSLQTFSSDESGRYVCTARNAITGGSSDQGTDLAIVDTCLNAGEVVGIVIGCLLLIIIIALLIWLVCLLVQRRRVERRQLDTIFLQRTKPNPRPTPPDPQPNDPRALEQLANPPLYPLNTRAHQPDRLYAAPRENRGNPQTLQPNGLHDSNAHLPNGQTHTSVLPRDSVQNTNPQPHNGIENPAFTHTEAQNANTAPNAQRQNPNIVIQAGPGEGGAQPQAVHVTLNQLPQTAQQNSNAQIPTIHVNLNSYPTNGQRTQQDSSFPPSNTANNNFLPTQQSWTHAGPSDPRMQSGPPYPSDPRPNGHPDTVRQVQPDLIPTGYTHFNRDSASQRNANTQTYEQEPEHRRRSDRTSGRHDTSAGSSRRQMPWDRLRGTPAYPRGTFESGPTSPGFTSDTTDYTTHPPVREERAPNRSQSRPQSQTASWSRAPPEQDASPVDRRPRSGSSDLRIRNVTQLQVTHHHQRSPPTQRKNAQQDIGGLSGSQTALRQDATHSGNPNAMPLMSQQASQGPMTLQGLGADTRALVDPNHLPQAYVSQQPRAASIQPPPPQGLGTQTQPVILATNQPRQGGTAPVPNSAAQRVASSLTHAALRAHTERAQTFQDRKQQTQAALLHPGPQAQAPAVGAQQPPTPPPVIPLARFQTLPKKSTQHRSPTRDPQPPRPPVNMPVAQRPQQVRHRPNVQHHPAPMPVNHHHHHHHRGNGHNAHRHASTHGQGHPSHFTHPRQQQAHRGRPR